MEKYFCCCCEELKDDVVENLAQKQYILYLDTKTGKYKLTKNNDDFFCDECFKNEESRILIGTTELENQENLPSLPSELLYLLKTLDVRGELAEEIIEILS